MREVLLVDALLARLQIRGRLEQHSGRSGVVTAARLEPDRLESLRSYGVSTPGRMERLDALARLAAASFGALPLEINLVEEREVITKGAANSTRTVTAAEEMLCTVVARTGKELVLHDIGATARLTAYGVVFDLRPGGAYAGVPLIGRDGLPLGAVCVYADRPRIFTEDELRALRTTARHAMGYLDLRRVDAWALDPDQEDTEDRAVRLRQALDQGELITYFQPVIELHTGHHVSIETLIRWRHPQRGLVLPGQFMAAVERSALVLPVGREVLRQALRQVKALRVDHLANAELTVAVNVSPRQVSHEGFAASVVDQLQREGLDPSALTVEVTETAELDVHDRATGQLRDLRDLGVNIALDDYGAGYSSLLRLLRLPITELKLDRRLVAHIPDDPRATAAAGSTLRMCDDLGLITVAEGIETPAQLHAVTDLGCVRGQGFLFARPVPPEQISEVLAFDFPSPVAQRA